MVSKRQRIARKRFKEAHPELFPKPETGQPKEPNSLSNEKKKKKKMNKPKFKVRNKKKMTVEGAEKADMNRKNSTSTNNIKRRSKLRKHPLRIPGMKPGESCFICKAQDHIAKHCPQKAQWEKNKICLLCRQRGHSLKNCQNKSESDSNSNKYCYNCGEAGHSLSNCPQPIQEGGVKFAKCFICNEQGHLSKHCPKNTHGIYPKGGSCKICGGVTHLAKYCPNKGNKDAVIATKWEDNTSNEVGESKQQTMFRSGDDLEDDFLEADTKVGNKTTVSHAKSESASLEVGVGEENVRTKKKQANKVVNFTG